MKAANLRTAASYLGCSQQWLETGLGDPGWRSEQHPSGGLDSHTVAHELSYAKFQSNPIVTAHVPVIGTLAIGEEEMFELRALPDGQAIGHVPASFSGNESHALQIFGDELYPAIRHGTCIIVNPQGAMAPGELIIFETVEGNFVICELVSDREDAVTWTPAKGGHRRTTPRSQIRALHAIVGMVPASQMVQASKP